MIDESSPYQTVIFWASNDREAYTKIYDPHNLSALGVYVYMNQEFYERFQISKYARDEGGSVITMQATKENWERARRDAIANTQ